MVNVTSHLRLVPVSKTDAAMFVKDWHRHATPIKTVLFTIGVASEETLVGVALVGYPIARHFHDGLTLEVRRLATDGHRNACSMLLAAAQRAGFAMGYQRIITYTLQSESGASLVAAGWTIVAERPARRGWNTPSRPRDDSKYLSTPRTLWEAPK